jgi:Leucine-rich repeat (LRR) protein
MKPCISLLLLAMSGVTAIVADNSSDSSTVPFKDANLEATIRKYLPDSKTGEPLTEARLQSLMIVTGSTPVSDLSGLEKCKKLTFVYLTGPVADLSPLKNLANLQTLTVKGGKVRDLTPLAGLTKLEYLDLSNNEISDVAPLANLKTLTTLTLSNNRIADLTALQGLTALQNLHVDGNQIANLKPLGSLKALVTLDASKNKVSDVSPLNGLTAWRYLHLDQNQISDLASVIAMTQATVKKAEAFGTARTISIAGNPLSASAKSQQVPELRKLLFDLVLDQ